MARVTIEDSLKTVPSRFKLVHLAARRAKQLLTGAKPLVENKDNNKEIVLALREIAAGKVTIQEEEGAGSGEELEETEGKANGSP